ncbi:MAG: Ig-like domain-containing protein [Nannocystales bacterium]
MRSSPLVLVASVLTACFSPEVDPNANAEGSDTEESGGLDSSGPGSESSTSGSGTETTVDPDTTVGETQSNTTDPNDAAPVIESFTVNGSTRPAEVDEGGTVSLAVEATDDVGVEGVEFFDGETSLGVVDSAPFEFEFLVSSADSGSHTYRAIATDTAGQTSTPEEVVLSVNIVGGVVEFLREDLFRGSDGLTFVNGGLDAAMEGRVYLNGIVEGGGNSRVMGFNDDLSQLWTQLYPEQTPGRPVTVDGALIVGGTDGDALTLVYRSLSPETGETTDTLVVETDASNTADLFSFGRVGRSAGRVVINDSLQQLAAYDSGLSKRAWLANVSFIADLAEYGANTFVSFGDANEDCATDTSYCVRRYGSDGQSDWTTGLPISQPALLAATQNGGAFAVVGLPDTGYEVFRIQPDGMATSVAALAEDATQYISGARADGTGGLVLSGASGDYGTGRAFVTRLDADGSIVWDQRQFFNGGVDSAALDVEVDGTSVFAYGLANNDTDFLSFSGDTWIARVSL